uniref:Lipoprotein n=1 Tax=Pseudomonas phage RVTF4 TaxID=3236931 RepID=A0AB39CCT2_9VIRU
MKKIILTLGLIVLTGCSDGPATLKAVEGAGYKDVQITGWAPFSCSEDDRVRTGFKATDQRGNRISGTYCSGLIFKGGTIRLD